MSWGRRGRGAFQKPAQPLRVWGVVTPRVTSWSLRLWRPVYERAKDKQHCPLKGVSDKSRPLPPLALSRGPTK